MLAAVSIAGTAQAEGAVPATDGSELAGDAAWDPDAGGESMAVRCAETGDWMAARREWMRRPDAWCAVEVRFRYAGSSGDIKVAVKREDGSARSALLGHASVDLPANGGDRSAFEFVFPCAAARADRLCLLYESTADAEELRFDFVEIGADAQGAPASATPSEPALVGRLTIGSVFMHQSITRDEKLKHDRLADQRRTLRDSTADPDGGSSAYTAGNAVSRNGLGDLAQSLRQGIETAAPMPPPVAPALLSDN